MFSNFHQYQDDRVLTLEECRHLKSVLKFQEELVLNLQHNMVKVIEEKEKLQSENCNLLEKNVLFPVQDFERATSVISQNVAEQLISAMNSRSIRLLRALEHSNLNESANRVANIRENVQQTVSAFPESGNVLIDNNIASKNNRNPNNVDTENMMELAMDFLRSKASEKIIADSTPQQEDDMISVAMDLSSNNGISPSTSSSFGNKVDTGITTNMNSSIRDNAVDDNGGQFKKTDSCNPDQVDVLSGTAQVTTEHGPSKDASPQEKCIMTIQSIFDNFNENEQQNVYPSSNVVLMQPQLKRRRKCGNLDVYYAE